LPAPDADDVALIEDAVRGAGEIARHFYGGEYKHWSKNRGEPVTEADMAVDRHLRETLLKARPDYGWISEESEARKAQPHGRIFIVDPIDGTTAFLKQRPFFSISVAVVEDGRPVAGVVLNPVTEECFAAQRGCGSRLNASPIHVSDCAAVEGCRMLAAADLIAHPAWSRSPNQPWPAMHCEQRSSVAYRMALVAGGTFDAALILSPKHDWDMAAGDLIVREAGGRVTDHQGNELKFGSPSGLQRSMICAGPTLHALMLARVQNLKL